MTILEKLHISSARDEKLQSAVDTAVLVGADHFIIAAQKAGYEANRLGSPLVGLLICPTEHVRIDISPALRAAATEAIASYTRADPKPRTFFQRLGDALISRIAGARADR